MDQQSTASGQHLTAKFNTDEYLHRYDSTAGIGGHLLRKSSVPASTNPFVNTSHLHFNKPPSAVVLPTSNSSQNLTALNPPPSLPPSSPSTTGVASMTTLTSPESSSTILKDLLKS